ncbi:DUF1697 domain-containing protein [Paradevosia shaoguanensis]|uniref:DUF1697 domain-containing protein n=1 Tax=Paradevosia shaoguanensis TaxID=1335043 RepID=UPI003C76E1E1
MAAIPYAAFLRGVNLGGRTTRSADLKAAFEEMGYKDARTLIASGNVLFSAEREADAELAGTIEKGLKAKFGFEIGVVLRSIDELRAMVAAEPFKSLPEGADAKRYVMFLREAVGQSLKLPFGVEGDHDVLSVTPTEIFAVAWHMPNGRYGEGLDALEKQFPKGTLMTMRNWNTILKAVA